MNFLKQQLDRLRDEIQAIYTKLSVSQRISIVLLAIVIALSLTIVLSTYAPSDGFVSLGSFREQTDLEAMKALLESNGIEYRLEGTTERMEVQVPRKKQAQARWLAVQSGHFSSERDNLQWLFQPSDLTDSEFRERGRYLESRERDVEDTLRWSRSIRNVKVTVQRGPQSIYASRRNLNDTALVSIRLAEGVSKLGGREARSVRRTVQGAFGVLPRNVQIVDDRGNNYPYVEAAADLTEEENTIQGKILNEIEKIYSHIFLPSQFVVGVLVDISHTRSRVESEKFGAKPASGTLSKSSTVENAVRGPGNTVGVSPNVNATGGLGSAPPATGTTESESVEKTETTYENRFDRTVETRDVPAGEVRAVSVNLVMDQAAVIDIIKKEGEAKNTPVQDAEIPTKIKEYEDKQRAALEGLIPKSLEERARVHVSTVMFPTPELPPEIGVVSATGSWFWDHWKDIALLILALIGLLAALSMLRRSIPAPIEIPKLEEQLLMEEDEKNVNEVTRLQEELEAVRRGHLEVFSGAGSQVVDEEDLGDEKDRVAESVELLNELTRDRPEVVTSVLKNIIQDAVKEKR